MRQQPLRSETLRPIIVGLGAATALSVTILGSSASDHSAFWTPAVWPWLLTGLQVVSLWAAGRRRWWGWLMGGSVQLPWIAYALLTDQIGFVPGCLISALVQIYSYLRLSSRDHRMEAMA